MTSINPKLLKDFLNELYPIGKTEIFLDNEDHSNYMGFTWQRDAVGRAIVGIDSNDTDFNAIGKIGGEKQVKLVPTNYRYQNWTTDNTDASISSLFSRGVDFGIFNNVTANNNNEPHNNLQPYKVFAIWVRTA